MKKLELLNNKTCDHLLDFKQNSTLRSFYDNDEFNWEINEVVPIGDQAIRVENGIDDIKT